MPTNPLQYLEQAELIHSEQAVNQAISSLAKQLNKDYGGESPIVLCVMSGGLYFTGQLLPKLQFPLELDYVQATRYHNGTEGKVLQWVVRLKENIKNRKVLILDDILDEGITLKAIVEESGRLGAVDIKTYQIAMYLVAVWIYTVGGVICLQYTPLIMAEAIVKS
jgi:hypoxanthine phosphoribosyltransferase